MFNRRKSERRAPTPAPVPDGEIVNIIKLAMWNEWNRFMVSSGLHARDNGDFHKPEPEGDDFAIQAHRLLREATSSEAKAALSALRDHFHVTITRKE